jgi:hypothetical protein
VGHRWNGQGLWLGGVVYVPISQWTGRYISGEFFSNGEIDVGGGKKPCEEG